MLFTGFMITSDGPKVLEYNVRFGDPETQALMLLLDDETDLAEVMLACTERRFTRPPSPESPRRRMPGAAMGSEEQRRDRARCMSGAT